MNKLVKFPLLLSTMIMLQACDSDSSGMIATVPPPAMASFDVSVANMTNSQPLSPVAVVAHESGFSFFTIGMPAGAGLETLAEGGDNSALLAEAAADTLVAASSSGAAPIGPSGSESVSLTVLESDVAALSISVASMLVNTNDAFSAVNGLDVSALAVGDSITFTAIAYDAGTESDDESAANIPGPAGGGEGFNAARDDDADRVTMHAGVISADDGLASSNLTEQHRFDNPVMRVQITRTQ